MKLSAFWKGLIMAIVGFIATTISDLESFNALYVVIATAGFTIIYVAKNAIFPSVSAFGLDLRDLLSGLILAVGMGISSYVAQVLTVGFTWQALWVAVSGAVVGYLTKTWSSNPKK